MAIKITIEQIDIEQAIKDHIGSMMEIKPDAQLDIDLSATRGSAGFTATILIRNADEVARGSNTETTRPTPQPEPIAETTPVATVNGKIDGRTKAAKALNIPKANENQASQVDHIADLPAETVTETTVDDVVNTTDASDTPDKADEVVIQEEAEQPVEQAPRASLFGGLTKPKN